MTKNRLRRASSRVDLLGRFKTGGTTLSPESLLRPPEALFCTPEPQMAVFMLWECVGEALGAQVRHVVTYRDHPKGTLRYTVFTKKVSKTVKKAVPPVLNRFFHCTTYLGGLREEARLSRYLVTLDNF